MQLKEVSTTEKIRIDKEVREYFKEFSGELSENAKDVQNASKVWNWLKENDAPEEVIEIFEGMCDRLYIPYVIKD